MGGGGGGGGGGRAILDVHDKAALSKKTGQITMNRNKLCTVFFGCFSRLEDGCAQRTGTNCGKNPLVNL